MGRIICYMDGRFFEFSTVAEGAVTSLMSEEEFIEYSDQMYGETYRTFELPARMERAKERGNSDMVGAYPTLEEFLKMNTLNSTNQCRCVGDDGELLDDLEDCKVDHWPGLHAWAVETWGQDYDKVVDDAPGVVMPGRQTTGE